MVRFGQSYLLVQISRACDAHSSPRKNADVVEASLGFDVNRTATAQTERMRTGGNVLFLYAVSIWVLL